MRIEYTKEGMRIIHPSGVVQVLSIEDLTRHKAEQTKRISEINTGMERINAHITKLQKIVKPQ